MRDCVRHRTKTVSCLWRRSGRPVMQGECSSYYEVDLREKKEPAHAVTLEALCTAHSDVDELMVGHAGTQANKPEIMRLIILTVSTKLKTCICHVCNSAALNARCRVRAASWYRMRHKQCDLLKCDRTGLQDSQTKPGHSLYYYEGVRFQGARTSLNGGGGRL